MIFYHSSLLSFILKNVEARRSASSMKRLLSKKGLYQKYGFYSYFIRITTFHRTAKATFEAAMGA